MTRNEDDPLERVRAADPAAGLPAPDHEDIRGAVTARLAGGSPGDAGTSAGQTAAGSSPHTVTTPTSTPADELTARRARRRPLRYAAAAVGALLLLGGGYALGAETGPGGTERLADAQSDSGQDEAADSGAGPAMDPDAGPEIGTTPQTAPDGTGWTGQTSGSEHLLWPGPQRTVFTAGHLAAGPVQAHTWGLDVGQDGGQDRAAQLAAALDVSGEPREQGGTWIVGVDDGSDPVLRLYPDGGVHYTDPELQWVLCLPVEPMTEPGSGGAPAPGSRDEAPSDSAGSGSSGSLDCSDSGAPAPPDAEATFTAFLTDAGLDPDGYRVETTDAGGGTTVTATLLVDGKPTTVTISATVVSGGIASVWGNAATAYDLGEYTLISPTEAVQRLADPRFSAMAGAVAFPAPQFTGSPGGVVAVPDPRTSGSTSGDQSTSSPALGSAPSEHLSPGSLVPWPLRQVQITTAELTLASVSTSAGVLLVPSYALTGTDADGNEGTWTVPALTEDAFDFTG